MAGRKTINRETKNSSELINRPSLTLNTYRVMSDICCHLSKFKSEGGERTLELLQKYKIQVCLGNLVAPRCTTCGALTGQLFACLHCAHFACSDHIKYHCQHLNHMHPLGKTKQNNNKKNTLWQQEQKNLTHSLFFLFAFSPLHNNQSLNFIY